MEIDKIDLVATFSYKAKNPSCLICRRDFIIGGLEDNDNFLVEDNFGYLYHKCCIDRWLEKNNTNPLMANSKWVCKNIFKAD